MAGSFSVRFDGQDYLARNGALIKSDGTLINIADALTWAPIVRSDTGANDSDKTFTVPSGKEWMIQSIRVAFTSTISTGERQMAVQIQSTGLVVFTEFIVGLVQAASLTFNYHFGLGRPDSVNVRDGNFVQTPIDAIILPAGFNIRIFDNNVEDSTGDDMIIRLSVLERTAVAT